MISHNRAECGIFGKARLQRIIQASPILAPIMRQWESIALPDCWLVAGAIAQAVWNDIFGLAPDYGVKNVDLVYFDASDLSRDAEADHEARNQGFVFRLWGIDRRKE